MTQMNTKARGPEGKESGSILGDDMEVFLSRISLPLEIRVHGRGGQGGVTCAKLCALIYSRMELFAQTFGDYGMERAGAPVRAYTRIDRNPIKNRNKIYSPGHLLILDPSLLGAGAMEGAPPGSLVLLNTPGSPSSFQGLYDDFRFATVNATEIARKHGIGTRAVVIVNTTLVGAYSRVVGLPVELVNETYLSLGLAKDFAAAREAYDSVIVREIINPTPLHAATSCPLPKAPVEVIALTELTQDLPTPLKTGSWRTQTPKYVTLIAPCNHTCPAGNDIVGFVQKLDKEGVEAAAEVLFASQPLPSVCGRVCPAPCMESCNRGRHDGAVNIRGLERWIGDHFSNYTVPVKNCPDPKRVAIVGGGPAGISVAYSLAKAGHQIDIFDGEGKLGGVLRSGIPAYRLPEEALDRDLDRVFALGVRQKPQEFVTPLRMKELTLEYDAVIVATGQAASITPEFPGIDLAGVEQGLTFLNRIKSSGQERIRGTVAVIGGGNTALDCAGTSIRCGADRVVIVYRRGRVEMPAIKEEIEDILAEGAELVLCRQPVGITGTGSVVTRVELAEVELGDPDDSGRRCPIVTHNLSTIACDHVLIAAGQRSDFSIFPSDWTLREHRAYVGKEVLNVWSAGDLTTGDGTVAHAIGNGRRIANNVLNFLEKRPSSDAEPSSSIPELVTADTIRFSHFPVKESLHDRRLEASKRISSFQEVNEGLSDTAESGRCFSCGHCVQCDTCLIYCPEGIITRKADDYVINPDYCKGCGICVWECPRHAMSMSAEGYRSKS